MKRKQEKEKEETVPRKSARKSINIKEKIRPLIRRVAANSIRLRQWAAENKEMRKEIEALKEAQKRFEVEIKREIEELKNSFAESKREAEHQLEMLKQRKLLKKQMKEKIKAKKIVERKKRKESLALSSFFQR